ncbi:hypothetical protein D0867_15024, partial [Hortaea werneckii]
MSKSIDPSSLPSDNMRDQSLQTQEHKSHSSRSSAAGEEDRDSTAEPRSPASLQMPGAKKTAADDVLALVSTNPGNTSSNIGDIESGAEHKEEPDSLSPRNTSHAEGLVIESAPQDEVHYATMSWWHTALACLSILLATFTALISNALTNPHPLPTSYAIIPSTLPEQTTLPQRALSLSTLILAYNGQIAYPTLLTEMHSPHRDFPKALTFLILTTTTLYILTATLIYHYAGTTVASPALGSAPPLGRKI